MRARAGTWRGRRSLVVVAALGVAAGLQVLGASPAVSQSTALLAMQVDRAPSLDPRDAVWSRAPSVEAPLTAQNVTYPFGGGGVPAIRVQSVHDGETLFVRVSWDDPTADDSTRAVEQFADAVAVQFPAIAASTAVAVCMGQADGGVNIWQWRADSEEPLPDSASTIHPDGYVDLYPSEDDLFFPAREAGNPYALGERPVQDLVAIGFGTLSPAGEQAVEGGGHWDGGTWEVVFARPFASDDPARPAFEVGTTTDVAFAAWDGASGDRNGQKSISSFLQLSLSADPLPTPLSGLRLFVTVTAVVAGLLAAVLALTLRIDRPRARAA